MTVRELVRGLSKMVLLYHAQLEDLPNFGSLWRGAWVQASFFGVGVGVRQDPPNWGSLRRAAVHHHQSIMASHPPLC